ncbi:mechanosensitive ion channel family protein [Myxosarcina sp. GI1(2024)]
MLNYSKLALLAQSAGDAVEDTARETRELVSKITTWKITQALIVILLAFVVIKLIDKSIIWLSERTAKEWRLRIKQSLPLLRTVVLVFTVVTLMNLFLNLSRDNILAITGTIAVALGFAFKDYASSIIAGIVGLFEAPYRVGDRVKIGEHYGEVVSYGLRSIRLKTPDDNLITIPHNKIWTEAIANANTGELEAQVVTEFFFAHEVDVQLIKKILYRVAQTSKYTALKMPIVVIMAAKPWGVQFKLKCYPLDARDEFIYITDLTTRAKKAFAKHHLAYPQTVAMNDEQ